MHHFDPKKTIFLVDASSYLYRAYYSIKPLHTPDGTPVNAVYGFCRMIKKLLDTFKPQYMALVWDSKGKTVRHERYPEYKVTRQAPPSDLFVQKELIIEFADMIGLHQISKSGIEADDLMYSTARDYVPQGYTIILVTGDKDMGQILAPEIFMYDPTKEIMYDMTAFSAKIGVPIDRLTLYFALLGDASDNIPGVRGIGAKSAIMLANTYSTLEALYADINNISPNRVKSALLDAKDMAFLSLELCTLQYYHTESNLTDLSFNIQQWTQAIPFFKRLNFKSMIQEKTTQSAGMVFEEKQAYWQHTYDFVLVHNSQALDQLCQELAKYTACALDTETDGKPALECALVGISLCVKEGQAFYVPCGHKTGEIELAKTDILTALKPFLEDPNYKKYLHNSKFDQKVLSNYGIELAGIAYDTAVAASLVAPEGSRVGLKFLSKRYFNEDMLTFGDVVTAFKRADFTQVPHHEALYYAAADAHQTFKLVPLLQKEVEKEQMTTLYTTIEHPITQILYAMEKEGIYCDKAIMAELDKEVTRDIEAIEVDIQKAAHLKEKLNFNSPKQVQYLLFDVLQLPPLKKSAGGDYSTRHEVLAQLADLHPVPALLIKHRELSKLKGTYIEAIPTFINPYTGRVHTTFNQVGIATGRLSSTDPNLQNIPVESGYYSGAVRAAFKPKPGYIFLSADYSQIELRVLAYLSQDKALVEAFQAQRDIHQETAAHIFALKPEDITAEQRQVGKRINFSLLYGVTPFGLSRDMKIPLSAAKQYIDRYFAQYPQVGDWIEKIIAFAKDNGYVQTVWGRRRYIPTIHEKNRVLFQEACRIAVNTVAQGTAAELMKISMINLYHACMQEKIDARMLLQIHDELLIEVAQDQALPAVELVTQKLESVVQWNVPLRIATRLGPDWRMVSK
ncbi:MAG TPA: DNA polymerase I [Candidatus Babeliales bacterium]|jgi:DNA polymerase-1|nr:DNA polymerase I [Candidatus Babeliales bacterium]